MHSIATAIFDTLKFANHLKTAEVPPIQGEAEAKALSEVLETNFNELVTKDDLRHEISDLRKDKDMDARFAGMGAKLEKLELRMTIKLGSIVIAALGVLTLIFKFFSINSNQKQICLDGPSGPTNEIIRKAKNGNKTKIALGKSGALDKHRNQAVKFSRIFATVK